MDYEQRYEKALERAKEQLNGAKAFDYDNEQVAHNIRTTVYNIFPELKESEDEKMRKSIIYALRNGGFYDNDKTDEAIAWIEKLSNKRDIHLLELKAKAYDDARERMSYAYNQNRVPIGFISEIFPNLNSYENQDDKPQDKSALETINEEKVEPKFKVGKWYQCTKDFFGKGVTFDKNIAYYCAKEGCLQDEYGCHIAIVKDLYDNFKLWTIEDAKDGDVLCYKDEISLYKHDIKNCTKQEAIFGGFVYHCCYDGKRFIMDSLYSLTEQDKMDIHPATKEQHDNLFQKMKEAGYKWNADKKELIKL